MCLDALEKFKVKSNIGYKVFCRRGLDLYGEYYRSVSGSYIVGKRYHRKNPEHMLSTSCIRSLRRYVNNIAKKANIEAATIRSRYQSGFHIFLTHQGAMLWRNRHPCWSTCKYSIRKVKFGTVVATGIQGGHRTVVAKTMTIL